jgi:hypothetical protein
MPSSEVYAANDVVLLDICTRHQYSARFQYYIWAQLWPSPVWSASRRQCEPRPEFHYLPPFVDHPQTFSQTGGDSCRTQHPHAVPSAEPRDLVGRGMPPWHPWRPYPTSSCGACPAPVPEARCHASFGAGPCRGYCRHVRGARAQPRRGMAQAFHIVTLSATRELISLDIRDASRHDWSISSNLSLQTSQCSVISGL